MSVCTFLAADVALQEVAPTKEYPIHIDIDNGKIYDGDADDNFFLNIFEDVRSYTDKKYGVCLEWAYYTDGRAVQILEYIKDVLQSTDSVEIWHVWLMDYYEYDERPVIRKISKSISELTVIDIKTLDGAEIWNNEEKDRPSFYCLKVTR